MTDLEPHGRHRRSLVIGALAAPVMLKSWSATDVDRFLLGVASGTPRTDSIVLWTRLMGTDLPAHVDVDWELATDERFTKIIAMGQAPADAAWGHSVHVDVPGLLPGAWYWYRFIAMGSRSTAGRTRTAPQASFDEAFTFTTASCQRWDAGYYAAWRHMANENPDVVLFLGDYIYEGGSSHEGALVRRHTGGRVQNLEQYRARYAQYKSDPDLQRMHAQAPWITVWDDHEVENDYAGLVRGTAREGDFAALRAAAYQAYWEHMPYPNAWRPAVGSMRIYDRYDWGRLVRIHALDDRQYRDAQACSKNPIGAGGETVRSKSCPQLKDASRSLLGAQQERWLDDGWSTQHRWNLVAQQTLMASKVRRGKDADSERAWTDGWDGYPAARSRLLESAVARQASGVVVVGGDVHGNFVADLKLDFEDLRARVVATEFCGTSITSKGFDQALVDELVEFNPHLHYGRTDERGYTSFRMDRSRLQARLRVLVDVSNPNSEIRTAAQFEVDPSRPGVLPG